VTKPKPLTKKQVHFFEAWGLPIPPSFGYAHGLIKYLCNKPEWWNKSGIPKKAYTAYMIDNFWAFHTKWVGKDVLLIVRDKEAILTEYAFKYTDGVVIGVVGRPVGECAFLKSKFGHVPTYLKLQVLLKDVIKSKVIGVGKVVQVRYNGEMLSRYQFYELYKRHIEYKSQDAWTVKRNRGRRLLTSHLLSVKVEPYAR